VPSVGHNTAWQSMGSYNLSEEVVCLVFRVHGELEGDKMYHLGEAIDYYP